MGNKPVSSRQGITIQAPLYDADGVQKPLAAKSTTAIRQILAASKGATLGRII